MPCHAMLCYAILCYVQVHVPLYDPSTVLLLAVCSTQHKVHKARVITRAVRSVWQQVGSPPPNPPLVSPSGPPPSVHVSPC